jgi:mannose-6-phosphate isomerase
MKRYIVKKAQSQSAMYLPGGCHGLSCGPLRHRNIQDADAIVHVGQRPWGTWEEFALNENCTVRILTCEPGQCLSDQRHRLRDEIYVILDAGTVVELDGETLHPEPGDYVLIPCLVWHRLICGGEKAVRVLEVAYGNYDQVQDIERRDDIYGRALDGQAVGSF